MVSTVAAIVAAIGAAVVLTGGLVGFIGFPKIVENRIEESLKLQNGSEAYKRWVSLPIPVVNKLYFFNISNPDDVQKGAKPIVEEIGPYVYNQYRTKVDVTKEDDVLSYYQCQRFEFDKIASAPLTEADQITIVNLPLMAIVTMAEWNAGTSVYQLGILNYVIPMIFDNPSSIFLKTTPRDFLFDGVYLTCNASGLMSSIVCNMIEFYAPAMMPRLEDGRFRFSLYGYRNNTCQDNYSINSGLNDINQLGEILAWKNFSTLNIWRKDGICDEISGSDGGIFPPFRTEKSVLSHFNTDICRTVSVTYSERIRVRGLEAYRYLINETMFASPSNYSNNKCYCLDRTKGIRGEDGCLLDGVIELWECQGTPVVISLPHFYLANEIYQNGVEGLKPNQSLHTIFLDLEPMTGTIMSASKRAQVNIFLRAIERIDLTTDLPTTLMPVLWIDESFELSDEFADLLITQLFDVLEILSTVQWSTIISGMILSSFGLIWVLISMWGSTEFTKLVLLREIEQ